MTADTRTNRLATSIGRVTPRRALLALGVATAVAVPGGLALAATSDAGTSDAVLAGGADVAVATSTVSTTSLSEADVANLVFMRQEEKLAADVYAFLGETWGLRVFENIQRAEVTHQSEVEAVMALYGVDDPVAGLAAGEFVDADLQALYDELVERGATSVTEALRVGALIEELDIQDLRTRASEEATVDALFARLEQGSQNHLRAFVRNLEQQGVDYEPEVLDRDDYDAILAGGSTGRAGGHGDGRDQGHGRGWAEDGGRVRGTTRGAGPWWVDA